jgi:hypothetical protein
MYVRQTCLIGLAGKFTLAGLHGCEIKNSVHQIVQTARITLPLSLVQQNNELLERIKLTDKIKEGDSITIDLGYDGKNKREFNGFIKRINLKQPLELECEDRLYLLRKTFYTRNFKKNSIKDVLKFLLDGLFTAHGLRLELYDKMPELTVTNFMIDNANGVEVLQKIADTYPMFNSYLTTINGKDVLYCGLLYGLKRNEVIYELDTNTVNHSELKFNQEEAIVYHVKVVNFKPDGTKHEFTYGPKAGQEVTLHFSGIHTEAQLKTLAEVELSKKVTGYRGVIETMLWPDVQVGDVAIIRDQQYGRTGTGYIGTVTTTFASGARRKPEIDISL